MRSGGEYFTNPSEPAQRRYEALRAYIVDELSAAEVAARFGYSPQVVHQMTSELRAGKAQFFASSKPGPKGPRKTGRIRDRVLELRAQDRSVTEIAQAISAEGTPVSAQTVWAILDAEGLERLERRAARRRGLSRSRHGRSRTGPRESASRAITPGCSCWYPRSSSSVCPSSSTHATTPTRRSSLPGNRWAACCWPSARARRASPTPTRSLTTRRSVCCSGSPRCPRPRT